MKMKEDTMKEGNTTPSSSQRGYPDMGDVFTPPPKKVMGNMKELPTYSKQMPAQK